MVIAGSMIFTYLLFRALLSSSGSKIIPIQKARDPFHKSQKIHLLGGIPIALMSYSALYLFLSTDMISSHFSLLDKHIILWWVICSIPILVYAHIDDHLEIRPLVKLLMQTIPSVLFSYKAANVIYPSSPIIAFLLLSGMLLFAFNGANLLDGLNTLSFKVATVICGSYAAMAYYTESYILAALIFVLYAPLLVFYFFNKTPAKVFLGELGACFLGYTYMLFFVLLFKKLQIANSEGVLTINRLLILTIPISLLYIEILFSFTRRILANKSPFSRDNLHVHHILSIKMKYSHEEASNLIFGFFSLVTAVSLTVALKVSAMLGFISQVSLITTIYYLTGKEHWFSSVSFNLFNIADRIFKSPSEEVLKRVLTLQQKPNFHSDISKFHVLNNRDGSKMIDIPVEITEDLSREARGIADEIKKVS